MTDAAVAVIERLKAAVGAAGVVDDPTAMAPYLTDWRGLYHGRAALVLRPAATAKVTEILNRQGATCASDIVQLLEPDIIRSGPTRASVWMARKAANKSNCVPRI